MQTFCMLLFAHAGLLGRRIVSLQSSCCVWQNTDPILIDDLKAMTYPPCTVRPACHKSKCSLRL